LRSEEHYTNTVRRNHNVQHKHHTTHGRTRRGSQHTTARNAVSHCETTERGTATRPSHRSLPSRDRREPPFESTPTQPLEHVASQEKARRSLSLDDDDDPPYNNNNNVLPKRETECGSNTQRHNIPVANTEQNEGATKAEGTIGRRRTGMKYWGVDITRSSRSLASRPHTKWRTRSWLCVCVCV
jgi:hypothetical protein